MTKMTKIYTVLDEYDEKVRNTLTGIKGFKGVAKCDPIKYNLKEIIMDKEIKLLETIAEAVIKQLRIEGFEI
jgi:hypothetical protein